MSTGIIRAPSRAPYDLVRRAVIRDRRLRYAARGVLLRLLSNADGYSMTAADLAAESPDGRTAVLGALRQLRDLGYVVTTRSQVQGGRWRTDTYVLEEPTAATEVGLPDFGSPNSGSPDVGGPDHKSSKGNNKVKQQQGRASGPATSAAAGVEKGKKRRRVHVDAGGVVTWNATEADEPGALVARHGLAAVAAAAAAIEAAGLDPVPGRVASEIQRQAAAAAAARAEAAKAKAKAAAAVRRDEKAAAAAMRRTAAVQRLAELDSGQRDDLLARFTERVATSHPLLAPTLTTSGPDHPMLRALWADFLASEHATDHTI